MAPYSSPTPKLIGSCADTCERTGGPGFHCLFLFDKRAAEKIPLWEFAERRTRQWVPHPSVLRVGFLNWGDAEGTQALLRPGSSSDVSVTCGPLLWEGAGFGLRVPHVSVFETRASSRSPPLAREPSHSNARVPSIRTVLRGSIRMLHCFPAPFERSIPFWNASRVFECPGRPVRIHL